MSKFKDITGQKFGRLTALYRLHNYPKQGAWWLCVCDCGNFAEVSGCDLRRKNLSRKSCGCLLKTANKKHGLRRSRLYTTWTNMKQRCYNSNHEAYPNYGGRGIAVCSEWKDDFQAFYDWAINNGYADTLTIDRIDVNGNYEPNNCRFTTYKQQDRNKRSNIYFTYKGETHCLSEWCEIQGLERNTVWMRINKYKYPIEKALELEA